MPTTWRPRRTQDGGDREVTPAGIEGVSARPEPADDRATGGNTAGEQPRRASAAASPAFGDEPRADAPAHPDATSLDAVDARADDAHAAGTDADGTGAADTDADDAEADDVFPGGFALGSWSSDADPGDADVVDDGGPTPDRELILRGVTDLGRRIRRASAWWQPATDLGDITLQQLRVIHLVDSRPDMTTGDLADLLGIGAAATSGLVGRLVQAGYVERVAHHRDRRLRRLRLTSKARSVLAETDAYGALYATSVLRQLDDADLQELRRLYHRIVDIVERDTPTTAP